MTQPLTPKAVPSTERFGATAVSETISPKGIPSSERLSRAVAVSKSPATVFTLDPAFLPLPMEQWLGGSLIEGRTWTRIDYVNLPIIPTTVSDGAASLDAALHNTSGYKIVYGHSEGAQVICKWLRDYGPTSTIAPTEVEFICSGNPERKYNGLFYMTGLALYGGLGVPDATPYIVTDFARQYDFFADSPNVVTNATAMANSAAGQIVHSSYWDVRVDDPTNLSYTEGNRTYLLSKTYPLPMLGGGLVGDWENSPDFIQQQDEQLRTIVESAYTRPMTVPAQQYPDPSQTKTQVDFKDADALRRKLNSDDRTAVATADLMAELELHPSSDVTVTFYDKFYKERGTCGDYIDMQCAFPRHLVETGSLTMKTDDPLAPAALLCHDEVVPVTIEVNDLLWTGRVKVAKDRFGFKDQADSVVCELEGDRAWLMKILAWPSFLLPIQVQFPPRGVAIGTAKSVIKWIIATQSFRLQSGLHDLINNVASLNLDWRSWMGTFLMTDVLGPDGQFDVTDVMRMLRTPIYVVQNPGEELFDTTPLISVNWRMDKIYDLIDQIVKDNGMVVEVKLWRPGDPQPSEDMLFPLTTPTIVVDVKDMMGIIGPTGTFFDGILRTLVDLQDSVFGEITTPFLNPQGLPAPEGFNIAPALGLNWIEPWALFNADHPQGGCQGEMAHHHPLAWRTVVGGKSPKWLNDLMNATWSWLLDSLMIIVGFTGLPSNLLDGLFNDILLAFQLADNMTRRIKLGPYGYPEWFAPTGNAPYNIDAIFALKREQWNTRGYVSGIVTFDNGYPYRVGRDLFPGSLASIIRRNKVYTDFIENIICTDTRQEFKVECQIGDGQAEEPASVKTYRNIVKFQEAINILTLSTQ